MTTDELREKVAAEVRVDFKGTPFEVSVNESPPTLTITFQGGQGLNCTYADGTLQGIWTKFVGDWRRRFRR